MQPTVHIINDSPLDLVKEVDFLQTNNYQVAGFSNGDIAFRTNPPDLLFVSLGLCSIEPFLLVQKYRKFSTTTGIIMAISSSDQNGRFHCLKSGADNFIVKPYALEELAAMIGSLLRRIINDKL